MTQINQSLTNDGVATIEINRPEKRNAFDEPIMLELIQAFAEVSGSTQTRMVVLRGAGPVFCAGGDIHWMRSVADSDFEQRHTMAELISKLMNSIYACPLPTIAAVHGAAFGGAVGLLACCDFVHATKSLKWATSEGKLGIIPACIAPFIVERIGRAKTTQLFLHAHQLSAEQGLALGLIDEIHEDVSSMNRRLQDLQEQLLRASPNAQRGAKQFLRNMQGADIASFSSLSATTLANSWASPDGKEGMSAFVDKRSPSWTQ